MKITKSIYILVLMGVLSLVGNLIGSKHGIFEALPGMIILVIIAILGIILSKVMPGKIPSVAYIVTIGCIVTYPGFPVAESVTKYITKVDFLSLTTPILAYVGISIGKDLENFKKSGWRIIVVSCVVFIGTYLGSAVIAQLILKSLGQI
ncbi:LysO family transporter [Clostridium botulinum C]|uniref:LysO family transporter n=1 Tax=Clostridium botulinum TaxID=1491 RepID=UPI001E567612|nr:LysO family transporter [Clostridium botulinum]MCD3244851.1 LysO family transporter [Clostridium botulinum C]MCD3261589.1 LysO family transporter [Clostridium botulinum C]